MCLLLCLAVTMAASLCQTARIPRGVAGFPNFHSVDHGYGATSYQNVQIENDGSVRVPTEDNHYYHYYTQEQPFIIHVINGTSEDEYDHETSVIHEIPVTDQQLIIAEKDHHKSPFITVGHEDAYRFISVDEEPHVNNDIQHTDLNRVPVFSFYHNNFGKDYFRLLK